MDQITHSFSDPDSLIDRLHSVFDGLERGDAPTWLTQEQMYRLRLAIHEWLANLVQHARFRNRDFSITITVQRGEDGIQCAIDDNSEGFDLNGHLDARPDVLDAFPERGMGLLMIKACTDHLSYRELDESRHRLEFIVSSEQDPWLNIPF